MLPEIAANRSFASLRMTRLRIVVILSEAKDLYESVTCSDCFIPLKLIHPFYFILVSTTSYPTSRLAVPHSSSNRPRSSPIQPPIRYTVRVPRSIKA